MLTSAAVVFACLVSLAAGSCRNVRVREDCGYPGIPESECLTNGCCYDESIPNTKWCYYESAAASPCASWECQNGGLCTTENNKVSCTCPKAYSGEHCDVFDPTKGDAADPCIPTPCEHGGTCTVGAGHKAVCQCPDGPYEPPYCEKTVSSPCNPSTCLKGGTCYSGEENAFTCQCPSGYLNTRCDDILMQKHDGLDFLGRTWAEMKAGIGSPASSSFWLGNDRIHDLTKDGQYKLRVDMQSKFNEQWYWAEYETFVVGDEASKYLLQVAGYSGNAGDLFAKPGFFCLNGTKFTTVDNENDIYPFENCAVNYGAFWQAPSCAQVCINCKTGVRIGFAYWGLPTGQPSVSVRNQALISSRLTLVHKY